MIILGNSTDGGILHANTVYDDLHKVQDSLALWGDYDFMTVDDPALRDSRHGLLRQLGNRFAAVAAVERLDPA